MESKDTTNFSFYVSPITNLFPKTDISIIQVYDLLKSQNLQGITQKLRAAQNKPAADEIKKTSLPYVTFSGIFRKRCDNELIRRSCYYCLDCDHLGDRWQQVWNFIIDNFNPVLLFRSPSSDGIKVIFIIDPEIDHASYFEAFYRYFVGKLGIYIDHACKNVSRACFLCYDPNAYLNKSAKVYGSDFVNSFNPDQHKRPRIRKEVASSYQEPLAPDKTWEIFNKLAAWADRRTPYQVGSRHYHKLILFGALQRNGIPADQAVTLVYDRCKKSGVPTESLGQFQDMAARVYRLYATEANIKI